MNKNFLIINNVLIPDLLENAISIYKKDLDQYIRMIGGNLVCEEVGYVWMIEVNRGEIDADNLRTLDAALYKNGKELTIAFLPPDGSTNMIVSQFFMTEGPKPSLKSWVNELPEWSGYTMTFEEVDAHD